MSDNTPRLGLPELAQMQEMDSAQINEALVQIDALSDLSIKGLFVNDPPASPADGDTYLTGGAPTGAWAGNTYKIAYCIDGGWRIFTPFDGLLAHRADTGSFAVFHGGQWTGLGALVAGPEVDIASAATCDLGAVGALCVRITGTTAITSLGTAANALRLVHFADALTLAHDATTLALPGGADIVTAAGDCALFSADASGNWRCRHFQRADGQPVSRALTGLYTITGREADARALNILGRSDDIGELGFYSHDGATQFGVWQASPTSSIVGTINNVPLIFYQDGGEAGRVGSDKSLVWGSAANGGWTGDARLAVESSGNALSARSTGAGVAAYFRIDNAAGLLTSYHIGATQVGSVTTSGTSVTYNTTSDGRLKTVLADQVDYRAAIQALWVGDFTWKATGEKAFGVIAQQAWQHMPWHMGVSRPAQEADAWHASAEPFGHLALWGVKDLYVLVERLAARIAELESRHAG